MTMTFANMAAFIRTRIDWEASIAFRLDEARQSGRLLAEHCEAAIATARRDAASFAEIYVMLSSLRERDDAVLSLLTAPRGDAT